RCGLRTHKCLTRRRYFNKGPNYLVYIDGYDKLKPFGLAIHGAICGTNNNPKVTAAYFLNYVKEISGVPRCIRMDRGTENGYLEDMQKTFRWDQSDTMSGEKSVIIGSSHTNQRIERWWRSMRKMGIGFWIDFFKDQEFTGNFNSGNQLHLLVSFVYNTTI
ncbi:hypothetical protein KUTeg_009205, partial [Tegillarca granosa]